MAKTYEPITTQTLSNSSTLSVTFSSIPSTYTDLVVVINGGMATTTGYSIATRINSDSGSNYSATRLYGAGSSVSSDRTTNVTSIFSMVPASNNLGSAHLYHFTNYADTTINKTVLIRNSAMGWTSGGNTGMVGLVVGLWRNTAAISSITFSPEFTGNWLTGTTFTLYGIKAA